MKIFLPALTFLNFFIFYPLFSQAALQAQNTTGAVASAVGGAGVGVVDMNDGALLNAATIPFFPRKEMSLSYSSSRFSAVIVDNGREALFPAGLAFEQNSNDSYKQTVYHLIVAYPLAERFSVGADFHMNELRFLNNLTTIYRQTLANAGVFWRASKTVSVGLTHRDIALNDTDLPDSIDHVTSTTLGLSYVYETFAQLRFDVESVEKQSNRYIYKIGLETYINDWIITRFGYKNDNVASVNFATIGVGFAGPQFEFHYAYQSEANNTVDPLHIIDLSVPF